eukprot:52206-Chlamydomonas_euryale.AAC.1
MHALCVRGQATRGATYNNVHHADAGLLKPTQLAVSLGKKRSPHLRHIRHMRCRCLDAPFFAFVIRCCSAGAAGPAQRLQGYRALRQLG